MRSRTANTLFKDVFAHVREWTLRCLKTLPSEVAMTSPLADILVLTSTGFRIFPCREKRPITKNGFKDASADPEQITAWWSNAFVQRPD